MKTISGDLKELDPNHELINNTYLAIQAENTEILEYLILRLKETSIQDSKFNSKIIESELVGNLNTPLHFAISNNQTNMVRFLISKSKLWINKKDSLGEIPLHLAVDNNLIEIVELLLQI